MDNVIEKQLTDLIKQCDEYKSDQNRYFAMLDDLKSDFMEYKSDDNNSKQQIPRLVSDHSCDIAGFTDYLRRGNTSNYEMKSGGYSLPSIISENVNSKIKNNSLIRSLARVERISESSVYYLNFVSDHSNIKSGWVENVASAADVNDDYNSDIEKTDIGTHTMYAQVMVHHKLLNDVKFNLENWFTDKISEIFIPKENNVFLSGDGSDGPLGLLNDPTNDYTTINTKGTDPISDTFDNGNDILKLMDSLPAIYQDNAVFMMSPDVLAFLRGVTLTGSAISIVTPPYKRGEPNLLFGIPVYTFTDMPKMNGNSYYIAYGDISKTYLILDKDEIQIMRDPYSYKPNTGFFITKTIGGSIINKKSIVVLKKQS